MGPKPSTSEFVLAEAPPRLPRDLSALTPTGPSDPIVYYNRPLVGRLYRSRIDKGLRLLSDQGFDLALEIGFGAGATQLALRERVRHLHGIDVAKESGSAAKALRAAGVRSSLVVADVASLPYPDEIFDLVVSFSVFEHIVDFRRALSEVKRVLLPEGLFLLGMPAVNLTMATLFHLIGFHEIALHHVTKPASVIRAAGEAGLEVVASGHLGLPFLDRANLYYNWLLRKTG